MQVLQRLALDLCFCGVVGMKFQKGQPRPANAGRKKGSLNKKKIPKVSDFLSQKDLNPTEEILKIMAEDAKLAKKDRKISKLAQIDIWLDLLSYCQARPKELPEDLGEDEFSEELEATPTETLLKLVKSNAGAS